MMRRVQGLFGLAVLLALAVGLPWALAATIGNPLDQWSSIKAGDMSDRDVIAIMAAVAYLAWATFALALFVEVIGSVVTVVTHRPRRAIRIPLLGMQQDLARTLIATVLLLAPAVISVAGPVSSALASPPPTTSSSTYPGAQRLAPASTAASTDQHSSGVQLGAQTHRQTRAAGTYVVPEQGGLRTYWALAEHYLGDGQRWPEIWQLNEGHQQRDGSVMSSPNLLRRGWTITVPAPAVTSPAAQAGGHSEHTVTVHEGDTLFGLAEQDGVRDWRTVWAANEDRPEPGGRHFTDPNELWIGDTVVLPGPTSAATSPGTTLPARTSPPHTQPRTTPTGPHTSPMPRAHPSTPTQPTTSVPSTPPATPAAPAAPAHPATPGQQHDHEAKASSSTSSTSAVLPAALATFGGAGCLLAAGIVLRLRRGRGRQQRHRGYRRLIPVPDGAQADIEFAAATAADPVDVDWLDEGLRVLGCALAGSPDIELPNIAAVYLHSKRLELVLADPAPAAPAPFVAEQDGTLWTLTKSAAAAADLPTAAVLPPAPALATVGLTRDQNGRPERLVLLDIEGIGSISVAGEPSQAADLLRFMAGDLAYNGWSVGVQVIACGLGPDLSSLAPDRIRCVSDIAALREHLLADEVFRPAGNPLAERVHNEYGDAWLTPRVVLLAGCDTDDDASAISTLLADLHAAGRSLLGVVIAGDHPDAHWHARLDQDGRLHLPDLNDLVVEAQTLPAELVDALGDTIERAESAEDTPAPPSTLNAPWAQGTDVIGGLLPETATAPDPEPRSDHKAGLDHADQYVDQAEADPAEAAAAVAGGHDTEALIENIGATQTAFGNTPTVRSLRPELDEARRALVRREALDPSLDEDLARFLDPPSYQATASILGRISVTAGGPRVPSRVASEAQATEFLVYLKLSENGKTGAEIAEELFAEHASGAGGVRRDQIRKIMGALREWLGVDADGAPYLPSATSVKPPRYLISDSLLLDWYLLIRLRARAQARAAAEHTDAAIADYRAALSLVRGRPFDARRVEGYRWLVYCGGLEHHVLSGVVDTAHELAVLGMNTGDGELVDFATAASMTADTYGALNQPYADRLRWQMMLGNKDRFSEIVRELIEVRSQNSDEEIGDSDIDGEPGMLINEFLGRKGLRVLGN
ncbi:MAG: hypothetical protein DLM61_07335 [Pseudonocardiales bacterium]|nr:MAG: hypothetical protein DLM61_07335 [Pseudonocardiales bacterium]